MSSERILHSEPVITLESIAESPQYELSAVKERVRHIPICIIIPDSKFLTDSRVFPFLGPLKVAAGLEKNGNRVEVLDLSGFGNSEEIVEEYLKQTDIRNFGLTATTPQIPEAISILQIIRKKVPDAKITIGGPHATLTHTGMIQDRKADRIGRGTHAFSQLEELFDKIVVGDGEEAVFLALDPENNEQIIDAGNQKSPLFLQKGTLDNFATPARHLIDHDSYHYEIDGKRAASVIGQLGCPFGCGFCGGRDSHVFRIARTRNVDRIIDEIESVVRPSIESGNPYEAIMFYDDELNISPGNLETLCLKLIEMQERLGLDMRFRGFVKAERFNQEQADLMYKAGFRILLSGVESGSDKILKAMEKGTTRETNSDCVRFAHNAGLRFKALMSIGHPGETETTVGESVEWVLKNLKEGDDVDWTIITQYPGSPYFDRSVYVPEKDAWLYEIKDRKTEESLKLWSREIDYSIDVNYYKGIPGKYTAFVWTDALSPDDLVYLRDIAEQATRQKLSLPSIYKTEAQQFEHSMGQSLPTNILRSSQGVIYQSL